MLTAQDMVKEILDDRVMNQVMTLANEAGQDESSKKIAQLLMCVKGGGPAYSAPPSIRAESECQRPRPIEDKGLMEQYTTYMKTLYEQKLWVERLERFNCAQCSSSPLKSFLTSCFHRYCEECFEILPDKNGDIDTAERNCCICDLNIRSIVFCTNVPESETPLADSSFSGLPFSKKRRNGATENSGNPNKTKTRSREKRKAYHTFSEWAVSQESSFQSQGRQNIPYDVGAEPEPGPEDEPESDWVAQIGNSMPGAKVTAVQKQLKKWLSEDEEAKIVIFTEFLDSNRLLQYMCRANGWNYALVCCPN